MDLNDDRQTRYYALIKRYKGLVYGVCRRRAGTNIALAEDLLQEVWMWLWIHIDELRRNCHPLQERAWIYWRARSVTDFAMRRWKSEQEMNCSEAELSADDEDYNGHRELLRTMIAELDERDRQTMELYLQGYRYSEIAQISSSTEAAVNKRMQRIVARMKEKKMK